MLLPGHDLKSYIEIGRCAALILDQQVLRLGARRLLHRQRRILRTSSSFLVSPFCLLHRFGTTTTVDPRFQRPRGNTFLVILTMPSESALMWLVLSALISLTFWVRYIFSCSEKILNMEGSATTGHLLDLPAVVPNVDPTFEQSITSEVATSRIRPLMRPAREVLYIRV